jgi:hypothetical protein
VTGFPLPLLLGAGADSGRHVPPHRSLPLRDHALGGGETGFRSGIARGRCWLAPQCLTAAYRLAGASACVRSLHYPFALFTLRTGTPTSQFGRQNTCTSCEQTNSTGHRGILPRHTPTICLQHRGWTGATRHARHTYTHLFAHLLPVMRSSFELLFWPRPSGWSRSVRLDFLLE